MKHLLLTALLALPIGMAPPLKAEAADVTVRFGSSGPEDDAVFSGAMKEFKKTLEASTNGAVEVQLFFGGSIGSNREMLEMLKGGALDMAWMGSSHASRISPMLNTVLLPYLWRDQATMFQILDGDIGKELGTELLAENVEVLGWWDTGYRHVSSNIKPIVEPNDMAGLKMRTLPTKVHIDFFRALGAQPTPMDWVEVIPALQQGVIDGQENPAFVMKNFGVTEVQKYYSLTGHVVEPVLFLGSKIKMTTYPPEIQQAVWDAARVATQFQREATIRENERILSELSQMIDVNEVPMTTIEAFRKTARELYPSVAAEIGGNAPALVDAIVKASN